MVSFKQKTSLGILALLCAVTVQAQQYLPEVRSFLRESKIKWNLTDADISHWRVSDQYSLDQTGLTYTYLQQEVNGLPIHNAVSPLAIREGKVVYFASRFHTNALAKANNAIPAISADEAVRAAVAYLEIPLTQPLSLLKKEEDLQLYTFSNAGIADRNIEVKLEYVAAGETLRLAWNVNISLAEGADWWNIRVDAANGTFLEKNNWTQHCSFDKKENACDHKQHKIVPSKVLLDTTSLTGTYRVFPYPGEAPNFANRALVADIHVPEASPFAWHDTNGQEGAEYTITRGNNVYAYEDSAAQNMPGYSPDGGPELVFDFPLDFDKIPHANQDAAITNLFYANNVIHDILYQHGFNEVAGNFQQNNYGKGGEDNDYVRAEAQDGFGSNNANFATPPDGERGRMQMFLWTNPHPTKLRIDAPAAIAGTYVASKSGFGPLKPEPISGVVAIAKDSVAPFTDACEGLVNIADLAGKIVLADHNTCAFSSQVLALQEAGAIGVLIVSNTGGNPYTMLGSGAVTIPAVMISKATGDSIQAQIAAGNEVTVAFSTVPHLDVSFDNGVITHEYGHGLSNRLTGGPSQADCLDNAEQGGEGWSDWLALIMSIEQGDTGSDPRGIGTYVLGEPVSGAGIRRYRYSTDMAINPQDYGDVKTSGGVHAKGEIWCATIWDLTWRLIEAEGFDPDWAYGTSGNNIAMRLVIEGMRLQPCRPGYLDARDAILAADALLYNNAHQCLIWDVFARRGMGKDAVQGSSDDDNDQEEGFLLPNLCLTATTAPVAAFSVAPNSCIGTFHFLDQSTDLPQYWYWNFGDGTISTLEKPWHSYTQEGTYPVTLIVTNSLGADTISIPVTFERADAPVANGSATVCAGNFTELNVAVADGHNAIWSLDGTILHTGPVFNTGNLLQNTTFQVQEFDETPDAHVGPANNTIGGGGYHNVGAEGRLLFEAYKPFRLASAYVYAQNAGDRVFKLYNDSNQVMQILTVPVPAGGGRVTLNLMIPKAGKYSIGAAPQGMYRNLNGATYPYRVDSVASIYLSSFVANPNGAYFYLYDWEVNYCFSEPASVAVAVTPGPVAAFEPTVNNLVVNFDNNTTGTYIAVSWNFGDGNTEDGIVHPSHTYTAPGLYTVVLTVTDGNCTTTYEEQVAVGLTGSSDFAQIYGVEVYPNPTFDRAFITSQQPLTGPVIISLIDASGRVVLQQTAAQDFSHAAINTKNIAAGVYQLRMVAREGSAVYKLTVAK